MRTWDLCLVLFLSVRKLFSIVLFLQMVGENCGISAI